MTDLRSPATHPYRLLAETVRDEFPILSRKFNGQPLVYLDNAATSQKPKSVLDAMMEYYCTVNSNVGRGYYQLSMAATEVYDYSRQVTQEAIGAQHPDEIVFTRSTTDSTNMLADIFGGPMVGPGDHVIICGMEHNSNLLPWRRLCENSGAELVVAPVNEQGKVSVADFAALLGPRTRMAAIAHVSNVLGTVNPVAEMVAEAHRHGIPVVVDGAQAIPHRPVNVTELGADFYCFSGHKAYGPMGIGVLYGRRDLLSGLPPYQVGGGTVKGVTYDDPVKYVPVPERLEAGTPNIAGAVGLAAALRYMAGLGWESIRQHDEALLRYAVESFSSVPRVRVIGTPEKEPSGIVSLVVEGIHPYDVGSHLDAHGVAVRSGVHCASTFLDSLGLLGTVRISFAVYNTTEEIDLVTEALRTVRAGTWTSDHPTARFL